MAASKFDIEMGRACAACKQYLSSTPFTDPDLICCHDCNLLHHISCVEIPVDFEFSNPRAIWNCVSCSLNIMTEGDEDSEIDNSNEDEREKIEEEEGGEEEEMEGVNDDDPDSTDGEAVVFIGVVGTHHAETSVNQQGDQFNITVPVTPGEYRVVVKEFFKH